MRIRELGEFGFIDRIKNQCISDPTDLVLGIGDDTAILKHPHGKWLLATTDMMVENVHFVLDGNNAEHVGYRAMAANVSDIAAMGGRPTHALISLGLDPELEVDITEFLYAGFKACAQKFGVNIVGGDTVVSTAGMIINIALLGSVEPDKCLLRSGANVGDAVLVTGSLGDARAGLDLILHPQVQISGYASDFLVKRHYFPTPRVREMQVAAAFCTVTAADDISDGLASEIYEIADASGVGAVIFGDRLPVAGPVLELAEKMSKDPFDYVLFGGEDFEVVFTVPEAEAESTATRIKESTGTAVTIVGKIVERGKGISLQSGNNTVGLEKKGYDHFATR